MLYNGNKKGAKTNMANTTNLKGAGIDGALPPHNDLRTPSECEAGLNESGASGIDDRNQKRSTGSGIAMMVLQLSLLPDHPAPVRGSLTVRNDRKRHTPPSIGVGGRRQDTPPSIGGGGYQDNCNVFEFLANQKKIGADPRMEELAAMGLPEYWLKVADYLGFDAFLGMWRILDDNKNSIPQFSGSNSMAPTLRTYANYLRFQKNRFVETLASQGVGPQEIQKRVQTQLCETISITHIQRITQKHKIKK
jgi:hypothetical protein